ncbi:MAG: SMC-Scp complex subunit ScpB, partial [Candidatus Aenigmarchaeota archaeon]|nr:SMC-Scp complex subunit ScpB [Candidatus Aenigmarchaeota archaeon]
MNRKALVEALIFVSERPLSLKKICYITGLRESEVIDIVEELKKEYNDEERG